MEELKKAVEVSLDDLKELWDKQEGLCAFLKIPLTLDFRAKKIEPNPIYRASLDRIDSSKGYIKGNIQFISLVLNFAKNKYSNQLIFDLIDLIKKGEQFDEL